MRTPSERNRIRHSIVWIALLALPLVGARSEPRAPRAPAASGPPRIEAVFVLDTTGSMSGLIDGAKRKIWSIANEMASADPTPEIRIGLIGYRDRGDAYVTRHLDLTRDLDAVYAQLQTFRADGGGDGPESVNQALHEALTRVSWSDGAGVYRVIFLVGDAPPHMDYPNEVQYPETVRAALARGITVNAVQCGGWDETGRIWKEIARAGEGSFAAIAQDGAMAAIETPVDEPLAALSEALADTVLPYGDPSVQREMRRKLHAAAEAPAAAAASRLSYLDKSGEGAISGRADLADAVRTGAVKLEELDAEALPEAMQSMDGPARAAYVQRVLETRRAIQERISTLVKQRDAYLKAEIERLEAEGSGDGFDRTVAEMIRSQAERVGIRYE
ncbi:MAG: VWA domain-containing protein [Deltaproteobacteria bacterium]|nr:MAG: VWA domain-containing protein [Deltaproteobacteria bacterium]